MAEFRVLYFRDTVLVDWEVLHSDDVVEAVQHASAKASELTAEVWSEQRKVAVIRAAASRALP